MALNAKGALQHELLTTDLFWQALTSWLQQHPQLHWVMILPATFAHQHHIRELSINSFEFDACKWGAKARLKMVCWTSLSDLGWIRRRCDHAAPHLAPSLENGLLGQCFHDKLAEHLVPHPWHVPSLHLTIAAVGIQPKRSKRIPLLGDFGKVLQVVSDQVPKTSTNRLLTQSFRDIPEGARLISPLGIDSEKSNEKTTWTFGIYRTPSEFVEESLSLRHPIDVESGLPTAILEAVAQYVGVPPHTTAQRRADALRELAKVKKSLSSTYVLGSDQYEVLKGKDLQLWKHMLEASGFCEPTLVDEVAKGFDLIGATGVSASFPYEVRMAKFSVEQVRAQAKWRSQALLRQEDRPRNLDLVEATWQETIKEVDSGWLVGPFTYSGLCSEVGSTCLLSRRFGLQQKNKIRVIDDFTESAVNPAFTYFNKVVLGGVDEILFLAKLLVKAVLCKGSIRANSSDGTEVTLQAHPAWKMLAKERKMSLVGRTLDLKSAYKQLPVSDSSAWASTICLEPREGESSDKRCFRQRSLPFGATASVLHFNRVARSLQHLVSHYGVLPWSVFFDDFTSIELSLTSGSGERVAEGILDLLGWTYSKEEGKYKSSATEFDSLGVRFDFSDALNGNLVVGNKPSRVLALSEELQEHIRSESLLPGEAASIKGKLIFAESQTFGRWSRWFRDALSERASASPNQTHVGAKLLFELAVLKSCLECSPPRTLRLASDEPPLVIFTDGAVEDGLAGFGAVLFCLGARSEYIEGVIPSDVLGVWASKGTVHPVAQAEMVPVILARMLWAPKLRERKVLWFLDSNVILDHNHQRI